MMESVVENHATKEPEKTIDRKKVCPVLIRVFTAYGRHHLLSDFSRGKTPSDELQIYTWMDASLKELTGLVKAVTSEARAKGTTFEFAIVYPDARSQNYRIREIGATCTGRNSPDDFVTLAAKKFQIGDFLDVAIVSPRTRPGGRGQMMRGRARPY